MRKTNYLYAVALTPLLMGAGEVDNRASDLTLDKLPKCGDNEYLVYRSGGLACSTVQGGGGIQWPNCTAAGQPGPLVTVAKSGDVSSLGCATRGKTGVPLDTTLLKSVEDKTTTLGTLVTQIEANPPMAGLGSYVGFNATSLTGHIKNKGDTMLGMGVLDNGLLAAAKFCEKDYGAGAHMCTVPELYNSAVNGAIKRDKLVTETTGLWVYNIAMQNPLNANPAAGLSDNCAGYTYETADAAWRGLAFQWRAADTTVAGKGDVAPHFYIAACSSSHKIACCK